MTNIMELARTNLIKSDENSTLQTIAKVMLDNNVGSVVITRKDEILGFVDEKAILNLISNGENPVNHPVKPIISEFPTLSKDSKVLDAWEKIKNSKYERYGITNEKNKIIGVIRKRTINDFRIRILKETLNIEDSPY
ncbi:MAG: CBS domain-containing protein [archaeon]|nr:CBS domain-containing protein [archaeon]